MVSHQISLRDEVYQRLKAERRPGESFSDAVDRLLASRGNFQDVIDLFGVAADEEEESFLEAFRESKNEFRAQFELRFSPKTTKNSEKA